jgi:hypothetical protein
MQAPGKNLRAYPKTRADGVAQVVACLPRKHEVLSSNPTTEQQQKKLDLDVTVIPVTEEA